MLYRKPCTIERYAADHRLGASQTLKAAFCEDKPGFRVSKSDLHNVAAPTVES